MIMHGCASQAEVDRVLGDSLKPNIAQYGELKYVMRCVNESMRLYPHPPVLLRRALVPDVLPGGYEVRSSARSPQLAAAGPSCQHASACCLL